MLERALPLSPLTSDGSSWIEVDSRATSMAAGASAHLSSGHSAAECVAALKIRPLLVGAAWKVLDVLLEEALGQQGLVPSRGTRWTIEEKVRKAGSHTGKPRAFVHSDWVAVTNSYVATEQLRHSLVHRTARTDLSGALTGVDKNGQDLRPLHPEEQDAFGRMALRAAALVTRTTGDARDQAALRYELSLLTALHGAKISTGDWSHPPREVRVTVDPDPGNPGQYILDLPFVQRHVDLQGDVEADLVVRLRDRPEKVLYGRLEEDAGIVISFNPNMPPPWLH